jgi:hypothetical protein
MFFDGRSDNFGDLDSGSVPMNYDPSAFRLSSPAELFRSLMPAKPIIQAPKSPTLPVAQPAPPAPQLAMTLPTASARSLTHLNFVSQVLGPTSSLSSSGSLALPPRPTSAPTGTQFIAQIKGLDANQREEAFLGQILAGNVPEQLRQFKEIDVSAKSPDGSQHQAKVRVLPDYLAIGSKDDYVLVPMTPLTAQKIADATGTSLPTRKLVNDIYKAAEVKLAPKPKPPGAQMTSTTYYAEHNATLQQQRDKAQAQPGQLIAGHKKDVVLSNRLDQKPKTVAIYGWHQPDGKAIQPLSTVHEDTYADYSHGIRLIGGTVRVDGVERPIAEVLHDPALAPLLSDEGALKSTRIKLR